MDGRPIKRRVLSHGSQVEAGNSAFIFLVNDEEPVSSESKVQLDPAPVLAQSTTKLRTRDAAYLQEQPLLQTPRVFRDLKILFKIASSIQSLHNSQSLYQHLFEWSFDAVPADRGAIMLRDASEKELTPVFSFDRDTGAGAPVRVSLTIAKQAMKDKSGILGNEVPARKEYEGIESLAARKVQSFVCIPIVVDDQPEGVLYLDTNRQDVRFKNRIWSCSIAIVSLSSQPLKTSVASNIWRTKTKGCRLN